MRIAERRASNIINLLPHISPPHSVKVREGRLRRLPQRIGVTVRVIAVSVLTEAILSYTGRAEHSYIDRASFLLPNCSILGAVFRAFNILLNIALEA